MRRHLMHGTRLARLAPGRSAGKRSDKRPCRARTSADPKQDQRNPVIVLLAPTSQPAAVVGWTGEAREATMNSAIWPRQWVQRKPTTTIYQLTDRLHNGHIARVPVREITATVSA